MCKLNKKGTVVLWLCAIEFILVIGLFFIYQPSTSVVVNNFIGSSQLDLLAQSKEADKAQLYLEESAKFASIAAINDVAEDSSLCGSYLGYSLWSTKSGACQIQNNYLQSQFIDYLNGELDTYLSLYPSVQIPQDNYDFSMTDQLSSTLIKGTATNPITVGIGAVTTYSAAQIDDYLRTQGSPLAGLGQCFVNAESQSGIPTAVILAMTIHESGWGKSQLANICPNGVTQSNNLFSIKATGNQPSCTWQTTECYSNQDEINNQNNIVQCSSAAGTNGCSADNHYCTIHDVFRTYLTKCDSVNDVVRLLKTNHYWEGSGKSATNPSCVPLNNLISNPAAFITDINNCGYSTSASWPNDVNVLYTQITKALGAPGTEGSIGSYSIKPNLQLSVPYSFSEYLQLVPAVQQIAQQTSQKCLNTGVDTNACLNGILQARTDFKFIPDCSPPDEKAFYGLVEAMTLCTNQAKTGYCTYSIPQLTTPITITETRNAQANNVTFSYNDLIESISQGYPQFTTGFDNNGNAILNTCNEADIILGNGQAAITPVNCQNQGVLKSSINYQTQIPLYNQMSPAGKQSLLSFINPDIFSKNKASLSQVTPVKKIFKICAQSNYNLISSDGSLQPVVYKIAFSAANTITPVPVQGFSVSPTAFTKTNMTFSFNANPESDIDHYNIYYSIDDFEDVSSASLLGTVQSVAGSTSYSASIALPKAGTYNFAATAVDTSGNENKSVTTIEGTTVDDLFPGSVGGISYAQDPEINTIDVSVIPPTKNEDGSPITGLVGYIIYLDETTASSCSSSNIPSILTDTSTKKYDSLQFDMSSSTHTAKLTLPSGKSNYCMVVVGSDGNPMINIRPTQYSSNSIEFVSPPQ